MTVIDVAIADLQLVAALAKALTNVPGVIVASVGEDECSHNSGGYVTELLAAEPASFAATSPEPASRRSMAEGGSVRSRTHEL